MTLYKSKGTRSAIDNLALSSELHDLSVKHDSAKESCMADLGHKDTVFYWFVAISALLSRIIVHIMPFDHHQSFFYEIMSGLTDKKCKKNKPWVQHKPSAAHRPVFLRQKPVPAMQGSLS